jgi:hypothetical protein
MQDEVRDQLAVLLQQEDTIYRCRCDYMAHERPSAVASSIVEECANLVTDNMRKSRSSSSISDVKDVDNGSALSRPYDQTFTFWRQQIFDWGVMVVDSFGMDREAVAVAFNLLDRYIVYESAKPQAPEITRADYQLFAMTCLYLAVKILESYPKKLSIQALVDMSKNYYSQSVIEQTELDILQALQWRLHAPTGMSFARMIAKHFPKSVEISCHMEAKIMTLTELAIADSFFVTCKTSTIGMAAVLHAARLEGIQDSCIRELLANLNGLIDIHCEDFLTVYAQLEKLYYH